MSDRRRVLTVLSVTTLASFLMGLNARLAIAGLPVVARDLGASVGKMLWIIQGYMIGSTIVQLIVGGLADLYGRVKLFNIGFLVFSIAPLTAGLTSSPSILIGSRIVQGVGGAFMSTLSITILTDNVSSNVLGTWLGVNQVASSCLENWSLTRPFSRRPRHRHAWLEMALLILRPCGTCRLDMER